MFGFMHNFVSELLYIYIYIYILFLKKEEALDRTMWRARFGRDFGAVVRQTTKRINVFEGG
jgi:hypothetical protein